jgi:hypothetical protein
VGIIKYILLASLTTLIINVAAEPAKKPNVNFIFIGNKRVCLCDFPVALVKTKYANILSIRKQKGFKAMFRALGDVDVPMIASSGDVTVVDDMAFYVPSCEENEYKIGISTSSKKVINRTGHMVERPFDAPPVRVINVPSDVASVYIDPQQKLRIKCDAACADLLKFRVHNGQLIVDTVDGKPRIFRTDGKPLCEIYAQLIGTDLQASSYADVHVNNQPLSNVKMEGSATVVGSLSGAQEKISLEASCNGSIHIDDIQANYISTSAQDSGASITSSVSSISEKIDLKARSGGSIRIDGGIQANYINMDAQGSGTSITSSVSGIPEKIDLKARSGGSIRIDGGMQAKHINIDAQDSGASITSSVSSISEKIDLKARSRGSIRIDGGIQANYINMDAQGSGTSITSSVSGISEKIDLKARSRGSIRIDGGIQANYINMDAQDSGTSITSSVSGIPEKIDLKARSGGSVRVDGGIQAKHIKIDTRSSGTSITTSVSGTQEKIELEAGHDSSIHIDGIKTNFIKIYAWGPDATITAAGEANVQEVIISNGSDGSAHYDGSNLKTSTTEIQRSDSQNILLQVSKRLFGSLSRNGKILYWGTGKSNVRCFDQATCKHVDGPVPPPKKQ